MKRSNSYAKSSLVPTLGFIALFLFGLNFHTAFSRNWDEWMAHRPKCRTAHMHAFQHTEQEVDMREIEREMEREIARAEREAARVEREVARVEREIRRMEHSFVPPAPPAPPLPPRIVIVP